MLHPVHNLLVLWPIGLQPLHRVHYALLLLPHSRAHVHGHHIRPVDAHPIRHEVERPPSRVARKKLLAALAVSVSGPVRARDERHENGGERLVDGEPSDRLPSPFAGLGLDNHRVGGAGDGDPPRELARDSEHARTPLDAIRITVGPRQNPQRHVELCVLVVVARPVHNVCARHFARDRNGEGKGERVVRQSHRSGRVCEILDAPHAQCGVVGYRRQHRIVVEDPDVCPVARQPVELSLTGELAEPRLARVRKDVSAAEEVPAVPAIDLLDDEIVGNNCNMFVGDALRDPRGRRVAQTPRDVEDPSLVAVHNTQALAGPWHAWILTIKTVRLSGPPHCLDGAARGDTTLHSDLH
mmetsp:Transcript_77762/g.216035  ORF Transcript_77762/g.216035 Transcript_77762/m.216035 type:complete len:354 (-) Transcript_77762:256-1317(-)